MTLVELLNRANAGYRDNFLAEYYDPATGEPIDGEGDSLAHFIVSELSETFEADADEDEQRQEASRVLEQAIDDIRAVIAKI